MTTTEIHADVFEPKFGQSSEWTFVITEDGWQIFTGPNHCDITCRTELEMRESDIEEESFNIRFASQGVLVPAGAPDFFRLLWRMRQGGQMNDNEVQAEVEGFASWISELNRSRPEGKAFREWAG